MFSSSDPSNWNAPSFRPPGAPPLRAQAGIPSGSAGSLATVAWSIGGIAPPVAEVTSLPSSHVAMRFPSARIHIRSTCVFSGEPGATARPRPGTRLRR